MQSARYGSEGHEQDLSVHIRTTRMENPRMSYSYISGVAVRFGKDTLEVLDDATFLFNGISQDDIIDDGKATDPDEYLSKIAFHNSSLRSITRSLKGKKQNIVIYSLKLNSSQHFIEIRVNTKTGMMFTDVHGDYPGSLGLLGTPHQDELMARDGITDLKGYWNSYGEEWQVTSSDPTLFHERRHPQHPFGCLYELDVDGGHTKNNRRRRLLDDSSGLVSGMDEEDMIAAADAACSKLKGRKKEFCKMDVLVTGDFDLADDPFYH